MAEPQDSYLKALLEARRRGAVISHETLNRIQRSMFVGIDRLTKDLADTAITPERAAALRQQMTALSEEFGKAATQATQRGVDLTIDDVTALHDEALGRISEATGTAISSSFDGVDDLVYANMAIRRGADDFGSLLSYRIGQLDPEIDDFLTAAVTRGVPSGQTAMDLAQMLSQNDPALQRALQQLPRGFRGARIGGLGSVDFTKYGIDPSQVRGIRTLLYDARRIAVSETNNALREANAVAMQSSPVVKAAKWQTSGRHEGLPSSPDLCDVYRDQDLYGLGPGMYPPEYWPFGPHSHCGCYQGGPMSFLPPSEWGKKRPAPPVRQIQQISNTPAFLKHSRDWSPRRLESMRSQLGRNVQLTESKWTAQIATSRAQIAQATQVSDTSIVRAVTDRLEETPEYKAAVAKYTTGDAYSPLRPVMNGTHDELLGDMARMQGFDQLPEIVDDIDDYIRAGEIEVWRGARVPDPENDIAAYARQFADGDYFPGLGIYGNGTYTSTLEATGSGYAGGTSEAGTWWRMVIRKDARTTTVDDLNQQQADWINAQRARIAAHREETKVLMKARWKSLTEVPDEFIAERDAIERLLEAEMGAMQDTGRFAIARGYDAYSIKVGTANFPEDYWVVLNRTAVRVDRKGRRAPTYEERYARKLAGVPQDKWNDPVEFDIISKVDEMPRTRRVMDAGATAAKAAEEAAEAARVAAAAAKKEEQRLARNARRKAARDAKKAKEAAERAAREEAERIARETAEREANEAMARAAAATDAEGYKIDELRAAHLALDETNDANGNVPFADRGAVKARLIKQIADRMEHVTPAASRAMMQDGRISAMIAADNHSKPLLGRLITKLNDAGRQRTFTGPHTGQDVDVDWDIFEFRKALSLGGDKVWEDIEAVGGMAEINELVSNALIQQWAGSSGDAHPLSIAMQQATRAEFGLDDAVVDHLRMRAHSFVSDSPRVEWLDAEAMMADPAKNEFMRAFVRAQHDNTQDWFRQQGISHVSLARGTFHGGDSDWPDAGTFGMVDRAALQPASSFSTDPSIAFDFGGGSAGSAGVSGSSRASVVFTRVPVEDIIGTARTGWGCAEEFEMVVLGRGHRSFVLNSEDYAGVLQDVAEEFRASIRAPGDLSSLKATEWSRLQRSELFMKALEKLMRDKGYAT